MTPNEAEFALSPSCHSVRFSSRDAGPLWGGCIPIGYSSVCPSRGGGVLWAGLGQDREQVGLVPHATRRDERDPGLLRGLAGEGLPHVDDGDVVAPEVA